ncbi:MAG: hypothetical protein WDW36_007291 [Sanguina aurantia]
MSAAIMVLSVSRELHCRITSFVERSAASARVMLYQDGEKLADFLEPELMTAPYDPRFPNRNQARHCFVRFNEYYK